MDNLAIYAVSGGLVVVGTVLAQDFMLPEDSPWWVVLLAPVILIIAQILRSYINTKVETAAEEKRQHLAQDVNENKTLLNQLTFYNDQIAALVTIMANQQHSMDQQIARGVDDRVGAREMARAGHERLDGMQLRLDNIHATVLSTEKLQQENARRLDELPSEIVKHIKKENIYGDQNVKNSSPVRGRENPLASES